MSDADLDALLTRGRLPDVRRAQVIQNVLGELRQRETAAPGRSWYRGRGRWPRLTMTVTTVAAAAAAMVLIGFRHPWSSPPAAWQARGSALPLTLEVGCAGGALDHCPAGSTLIFRAQLTEPSGGYLAGYADPLFPGGQRVWYFSGEQSPWVPAGEAPVTMKRGIHLGAEHAPGRYLLHLTVTRARSAQNELATTHPPGLIAAQTLRLTVVP